MVEETYGPKKVIHGVETYDIKSPLKAAPFERGTWNIKSQRTGLLARKIGVYPLWTATGEKIVTTLLQVADICFHTFTFVRVLRKCSCLKFVLFRLPIIMY